MRRHSTVLRSFFAASVAAGLTACGGHAVVPQTASGSKTADALLQAPAAAETLLHSFGGPDGAGPPSGVVSDGKGDFFGATIFGGKTGNGTIFELKPKGDGTYSESVLYSFTGGPDGSRPVAGVAIDSLGALYTNTLVGGNVGCVNGCGAVDKLTPGAKGYTETTIYGFLPGADANQPVGTPVVDAAGAVYGATQFGGTSNAGGSLPQSGVAIDSGGNIFGETQYGGVWSPRCAGGCGVIFKLKVAGKSYTPQTIFQFHGDDGDEPMAAVTVDRTTGIVYGTTQYGGSDGRGVIFALTPSRAGYTQTVLHSITGRQTGLPLGPLLLAPNGTLYGTMVLGGGGCSGIGCGQVFKLGRNGSKYFWSVIFGFRNALNGADPENTSLIQDSAGAIYGTTRSGGAQTGCSDGGPGGALGCGVVFKLTGV